MLAVVDAERGAGDGIVAGQEHAGLRHAHRIDRPRQQVELAGASEVFRRLRAAQVHQAGRQADHAHTRRQRLRLQRNRALQRQLGHGVGEIVGVQVEHLLVQHMEHHGHRLAGRGLRRGARQQRAQLQRCQQVHLHLALHHIAVAHIQHNAQDTNKDRQEEGKNNQRLTVFFRMEPGQKTFA